MFLDYTPDQLALSRKLRAYLAEILGENDVLKQAGEPDEDSPLARKLLKRMGADGWLGIGWPREYGGQGLSAAEQFIFNDEINRASGHLPVVTMNVNLNLVGPSLIRYATDDQKRRILPAMLRGEAVFAVGYTEPEAGTDLASLRTRAVRDGGEWVVNGSKVFTTGALSADYVWLACRTNVDVPKHQGISMMMIPTTSEGFSATPIHTVASVTTSATFYDDVRVPLDHLVGFENDGWRMITSQLAQERVGMAGFAGLANRLFDDVRTLVQEELPETGERLIDQPWVRLDLAKAHLRLEAIKLLNWRLTEQVENDQLTPADASGAKFFSTEGLVEVYRLLAGILGPLGQLRQGAEGAIFRGDLERINRGFQLNTYAGGTNDVQREIVASNGLKMAKNAR